MKFIRNGRIRERIVDALAKGILIAFSALVCLWMISGARASTGELNAIRQESLGDGMFAVDFILSKPVAKEDVSVEFQRNFIQVSIRGVSAYPARTEKLNHDLLEKVFTYQYQPDLARARVLLRAPASTIKAQSSWEIERQKVRILVRSGPAETAARQVSDSVKSRASSATGVEAQVSDPEEVKVRNEILKEAASGSEPKETKKEAKTGAVDQENLPLFSSAAASVQKPEETGKKDSPATKILAALLLVVGMIGAGSLAFRRFVQGKSLGFQRQPRMIEVISSQALGPKRSIALVKVLDQHLVVGMSGDGMNLLANLGSNVNLDSFTDDIGGGASFTETLQDTLKGGIGATAADPRASLKKTMGIDLGFRDSIKKRLEGFKPL